MLSTTSSVTFHTYPNLQNTVLFHFIWFVIIRTVRWRMPHTICLAYQTLNSVLFTFFLLSRGTILWLNYHDLKIQWMPTHDIRKHWTAVSTLLGLISSAYRDLRHWRSDQWPQITEPKLYNSPYRTQVTPNQVVMVIARPIDLNASCKLHPYSLQRTRSPLGPCLSKMN